MRTIIAAGRGGEAVIKPETYNLWAIKCPYCGHVDEDAWEWEATDSDFSGDWECPSCGEVAHVTRYTEVSYTATRNEPVEEGKR